MNTATDTSVNAPVAKSRRKDAVNNPTSSHGKELHTDDLKVGQREDISLGENFEADREDNVILPVSADTNKTYLEALAFGEQAMKIRIESNSDKNAPKVVDCWVNGIPAEEFHDGKWHKYGYLAIGRPLITRRKFVEVLARAKPDSVQTSVVERDNADPENVLQRFTSVKYPFSVLEDRDPKGADWLNRIIQEG